MEMRSGKIIISSAGGTASKGAKTYKVSLPSAWINSLELSENNREIELSFDGEKIVITPKSSLDDFIESAKKKGHKLLKINKFSNFTDNSVYTAFGIKHNVSWYDYNSFLEDRCIPKNRMGIRDYLISIGIYEYAPIEIIKKTHGRMAEDNQWIKVEEL